MGVYSEVENQASHDRGVNETSEDVTTVTAPLPQMFSNGTTATPTHLANTSQINMTSYNSTTTPFIAEDSTSFPDFYNHTDLPSTPLTQESNDTQVSTTIQGLTDSTTTPEIKESSTVSSATTLFPSETTETTPVTLTTTFADIDEEANLTNRDLASGSDSERDLPSEPHKNKRVVAWGVILGTMVVVACVGLVAYVILKKRHQKLFSHRKLVEEYPSDPVLRLDNSEPLDLKFGGLDYYNPGLQGDNIQMRNFPQHR
nr:mucin-15 [Monopterus albus]